jgi:hypothetical protein
MGYGTLDCKVESPLIVTFLLTLHNYVCRLIRFNTINPLVPEFSFKF